MKNIGEIGRDELQELVVRRDREIDLLLEVNRRLKGHFHLETLLKEIMNLTKDTLESEACSLLLIDEETEELFFYVTDDSGANLSEIVLQKGQGIVGKVAQSGEPLIVNDTNDSDLFFSGVDDKTGFVTRSLACVPMGIGKKRIGVVEVLNKKKGGYGSDDVRLLDLIAAQSAVAIEHVNATEKRSLNDRMATVGGMAGSMIHDLRNSMQVISGFTQLISMQVPEQEENCTIINNEIDRLIAMSHEVMEYSRGSEVSLQLRTKSLSKLLEDLVKINRARFANESVTLNYQLKEDVDLAIDSDKIGRVLQNMLNNAVDSMEECTNKEISLTGGVEKGIPWVKVVDSGKGMDQETLKNLFKPFFTKGKQKGTGLGMAIVDSIINAHGARIEVSSEMGAGSEFIILFEGSKV